MDNREKKRERERERERARECSACESERACTRKK